jgi:hypothetical protein
MYSVWNAEYLEYTIIIFMLGSIVLFTGIICCLMVYLCIGFFQERERRSIIRLLEAVTG